MLSCVEDVQHLQPRCIQYYDSNYALCRGYTGWIRQVTEDSVRFELEAQQRTVTVARSCLPPEAGGAPAPRPMPVFGQAGLATPARIGSQTPSRGSWVSVALLHSADAACIYLTFKARATILRRKAIL